MKKYCLSIIILLTLFSCQTQNQQPEDLMGKRGLIKVKKEEVRMLQEEILNLQEEINKLDPPKEKPPVLVNAIPVEFQKFTRYVDLQGSVVTDEVANASSELGGRIIKSYVAEGSQVKKGQLMARLDMKTIEKQIDEINTAKSLANTVYERQKRLWEQEIGSEIQYLQAKNKLESLEKSLATLNSQYAKRNVYAPISGVVEDEFLKSGEMASPGMPIFQIMNTSKVKVEADIPENYLGKLKKGDLVDLYFPALDITLTRKITSLGRTIDPSNRTFTIDIQVNNKDGMLKPHLLAEVKFIDFQEDDVILAPIDFVLQEVTGENFVYVIELKDDKSYAKKVMVQLGESHDGNIIIREGINKGDNIITQGARNLAAGDPVIIANENKEAANNGK